MRDISDILTVSFDSGLKDEAALCVTRKRDGDYSIIKMELGEQADILYYLLTNQIAKAEIKTEKWIPVSERLPENNMPCLVAVGKFYLTQMAIYSDLMGTIDHKIFYQGNYGDCSFDNITEYVKAWMPLPEPYKPKEVEE